MAVFYTFTRENCIHLIQRVLNGLLVCSLWARTTPTNTTIFQ